MRLHTVKRRIHGIRRYDERLQEETPDPYDHNGGNQQHLYVFHPTFFVVIEATGFLQRLVDQLGLLFQFSTGYGFRRQTFLQSPARGDQCVQFIF